MRHRAGVSEVAGPVPMHVTRVSVLEERGSVRLCVKALIEILGGLGRGPLISVWVDVGVPVRLDSSGRCIAQPFIQPACVGIVDPDAHADRRVAGRYCCCFGGSDDGGADSLAT